MKEKTCNKKYIKMCVIYYCYKYILVPLFIQL